MIEIVKGIGYLHQRGIIHGDLKPENVLNSDDGQVKIGNYSISKYLPQLFGDQAG